MGGGGRGGDERWRDRETRGWEEGERVEREGGREGKREGRREGGKECVCDREGGLSVMMCMYLFHSGSPP